MLTYLRDTLQTNEQPKEVNVFLERSQWNDLANRLSHYFYGISLSKYGDSHNGFIFVSYQLVGISPKYAGISSNSLKQCITFDICDFLEEETGCVIPIYIDIFNSTELKVLIPYNRATLSKLESYARSKAQREQHKNILPQRKSLLLKHCKTKSATLTFGIIREEYIAKGLLLPITINLQTHPHILLTGSSGSGKSYLLKIMISQILERKDIFEVWIGDYKNSPDFRYLNILPHYAADKDVITLIFDYYTLFQNVKSGNLHINYVPVLILDEYPAMIMHLELTDKTLATSIKLMIADLLMSGRSIQNTMFPVWLTAQRPDATIFSSGGARDNFMVKIALGNLSNEAKRMFTDNVAALPQNTYKRGEGLISIDGREVEELYVPEVANMDEFYP